MVKSLWQVGTILLIHMSTHAVTVDGVDTDWENIPSQWSDPSNDGGSGTRDITLFKWHSDDQNLYGYCRFAQPYGAGPQSQLVIYIDADLYAEGTGADGLEIRLQLDGAAAGSSPSTGQNHFLLFDAQGNEQTGASGAGSHRPNAGGHSLNWVEFSFPLSTLKLKKGRTFRFIAKSHPVDDFLQGQTSLSTSSLFFTVGDKPIQVDGADTDWLLVHSAWTDPKSDVAINPQADMLDFKLASDRDSLYLYFRTAATFDAAGVDYPELVLYIDTDGNATNGFEGNGHEAKVVMVGANKTGQPTGYAAVHRFSPAFSQSWGYSRKPDYTPHGGSWSEYAFPLDKLGLAYGQTFHFMVRTRSIWSNAKDFLASRTTLAEALTGPQPLRYTIGGQLAMDGFDKDWEGVRTAWNDPLTDGSSNDLVQFKLHQDDTYLYAYYKVGQAYGSAQRPEIVMFVDSDQDTATGCAGAEIEVRLVGASSTSTDAPTGGTTYLGRLNNSCNVTNGGGNGEWGLGAWAPRESSHSSDWAEYALPLQSLGLKRGTPFRFFVKSKYTNNPSQQEYLQDWGTDTVNHSIRNSRHFFPHQTVHIGANMHNLNSSNLAAMKTAFMEGEVFNKGRFFDVQLAAHSGEGTYLPHNSPVFTPTGMSFDFTYLDQAIELFRSNQVVSFHHISTHDVSGTDFDTLHKVFWGPPKLKDKYGVESSSLFMPYSPDAPGASIWMTDYIRKAVVRMRKGFGESIGMTLFGNEMMYPRRGDSNAVSYDMFTTSKWKSIHGISSSPPTSGFTEEFVKFRSSRLKARFLEWTGAANSASRFLIPNSVKLAPYELLSAHLRASGYFPYLFDYLDDPQVKTMAINHYPPKTYELQKTFRLNKTISLTEFGGQCWNTASYPSQSEVTKWLTEGIRDYNVRSAFIYSWDGNDTGCTITDKEAIGDVQKVAMKAAIQAITSMDRPLEKRKLVRGILPNILSSGTSNFGGIHPDVLPELEGLWEVGEAIHMRNKEIGFELDYENGPAFPDVTIRFINGDETIDYSELMNKKTIFLFRGGNRTLTVTGTVTGTVTNTNAALDGRVELVSPGFSMPVSTLIKNCNSSQGPQEPTSCSHDWFINGNKSIVTTGLPDVTVLGQSAGNSPTVPVVVRVGKSAVFIAGDMLWYATKSGHPNVLKFFAELVKKMVYEEF